MSSSKVTQRPQMPVYSRIFSVRTLFQLLIVGCSLIFALILLWSGTGIMNLVIKQFGTEILTEKLNTAVQSIEDHYAILPRIGLDDSAGHRDGVRQTALKELSHFRYKETGSSFVISKTGEIILSSHYSSSADRGFADFFAQLRNQDSGSLTFTVDGHDQFSVFRFYPPWNSYIGIAIDQHELFAYKDLFIRIVLMLLAAVLLGTFLLCLLRRICG